MKRLLLLTVVVSVFCVSCTYSKNKGSNAVVPIFQSNPLDSAYGSLRPVVQRFTIDNQRVNTVKAANGTEILIPADCFVLANGDRAAQVELEIVEAFSLKDFVVSGLATLSQGQLLESNGMLYINAKAGPENLRLAEGASLTVSMPTMKGNSGFQLFTGDGRQWTVDSGMTEADCAIPLPLDLLYPEGINTFWHCISDVGGKTEKRHLHDTTILNVTRGRYENTVIATEEFVKRADVLRWMMHRMSYFVDRDYYYGKFDCGDQQFNYDIWKVYFDHPTRSFRASDSIAKKMFVDYFASNKEKLAAFCDSVNVYRRLNTYNWTDTNYYFDFRKQSLEEHFMEPLQSFPAGPPKEIKVPDSFGVHLGAPDAFAQLSGKGISVAAINGIMGYHFRREAKIRQLQRAKAALVEKGKLEKLYATTVYTVSRLGWINCDRFFNDPDAGKAAIYVSHVSSTPLDFIDYSLIIPSLNARLSAYQDSTGRWTFTRKEDAYSRLPIGRHAVITGISLRHDSLFFGSRRIIIKDSLAVELPMQYIRKENLKDSLEAVLKE